MIFPSKFKRKIVRFAHIYHNFINYLFIKSFTDTLNKADITPIFTKDKKCIKNNYRAVSILPSLSKIFERCIYDEMNEHFHPPFSKLQCGYWKGFNAYTAH